MYFASSAGFIREIANFFHEMKTKGTDNFNFVWPLASGECGSRARQKKAAERD